MKKLLTSFTCFLLILATFSQTLAQIVTSPADDGSPGTFRHVVLNAAAGSEIVFSPLLTSITLNSEINISKSLIITGDPVLTTTIDGNNSTRIFNITAGVVTLNNLTMTNGTAADGGAIFNSNATLEIAGCVIENCTANGPSGSGGAIYNDAGGSITITNTEISGNVANRAGGGIEDNSGAGLGIVMLNVNLDNNIAGETPGTAAPGNGGGLHVTGAGDISITGGTVNNNSAALEGGGLWNGSGTMTIIGTTIDGNSAAGAAANEGGGGIFNAGGSLDILNATITGNTAIGASGSGGGILNDQGTLIVVDTEISGNSSVRAGGGIEEISVNGSLLTLTNVTLNNNTTASAPGNGGGLHITGAGDANITGGTAFGNTASAEGGALWNGTGTMTVDGMTIDANFAMGASAGDGGGGVFNNGGTLNIMNGTLIVNNMATGAAGSGGGLLSTDGDVNINSASFNNNSAVRAGGAIEIIDGNLTFTNSTMVDNDVNGTAGTPAPGNGGGLHVSGNSGTIMISGSIISGNEAGSEGGGLWNQSGTTMTVTNSNIDANIAFGANADNGGGGIFNNGGTLNVMTSAVTNNQASGSAGTGGGIHNASGGDVDLMVTTVSGNSANAGGGIFNEGDSFEINAVTIAINSATVRGGGIESSSGTTLENTIVAQNNSNSGVDVSGNFISNSYNLIGTDDQNDFPEQPGDMEEEDPMLGPLDSNGNDTPTHRLQPGSPAFNAGNPNANFADQNGQPVFDGRRDIGSDESQIVLTSIENIPVTQTGIEVFPNPTSGLVTLRVPSTFGQTVDVDIFEMASGKLVYRSSGSAGEQTIDLTGMTAGTFSLRIISGEKATVQLLTLTR